MATSAPSRSEHASLRRAISGRVLLLFVVGDILGAGIYAVAGELAGEVGGGMWAAMLVAFVLALLTAVSYAELVTKYPGAAGAALYTQRAFRRPFLTFLVAVAVMASGIASASTAALAFGGDYLAQFVAVPQVLAGLLFVAVLALVNYWGIRESTRVNVVLTLVEAGGLVVVVVIGVLALTQGQGEAGRLTAFPSDRAVPLAILSGAALAFFSFIGFEDSVNLAEETKKPRRVFPAALLGGLVIAFAFYMLVTVIAAVLVPANDLAGSSAPLLLVVQAGAPAFPPRAFAAVALLAVSNTALINLIMASRLLYGLGDQGVIPAAFARLDPRRRTPWLSIVIVTAVAGALIATGSIGALADTTVLLLLLVFTLVNVAVLVLRRDDVGAGHLTAPTAVPVLGALSSGGLAVYTVVDDPGTALRAVLLLAAGVVLWAVNHQVHGRHVDASRLPS